MQSSLASDILRCHYGTLAQSLQYPISVAQLFNEEGIISDMTSANVKSTAESLSTEKALSLLLKAVRHTVHTNYHSLEIFASALLKQTGNVPWVWLSLKIMVSMLLKSKLSVLVIERDFLEDTFPKLQLDNTGSTEGIVLQAMSVISH